MMKVTDFLEQHELLAGLGEEAAELAAAALKMRRVIATGTVNPTPMGYIQSKHDLAEEIADVFNYLDELHVIDWDAVDRIKREKHRRWIGRLTENRIAEDEGKGGGRDGLYSEG